MQHLSSLLTLGSVFLSFSACSMRENVWRDPVTVPTAWKSAAGFPLTSPARDLARWWKQFDDPTLNHLIATALQNSPNMASAASQVRQARAQRQIQAASLLPSITGSASTSSTASRRDGSETHESNSYSADLDTSWEIDLFGTNRLAVEAAAAKVGASEENYHSLQAALAAEIAIIYTNLRVDEASCLVLRKTISSREETHQLASWRTQSGEADSLESSQALSSLEQARAALPAFEQSMAQARNSLSLLAGLPPGSVDRALASGKNSVPHPERRLAVGIPADTIRQRPDVRVAGFQLLAAAADARRAVADQYPSLRLNGSLGLDTLTTGRLFDPEAAAAALVAGITSPIFDAGRIHATIDSQNAAEEQAYQNYRSTVLTALAEVENALIACRKSGERLVVLEKATAAAEEAATLAKQRYQVGVIDIQVVLDSQRVLLGLHDNLFNAQAARTISYIQLYKALGGGWL